MPIYQRADKSASTFKAHGAPVLSSSQRSGRMIERKLSTHPKAKAPRVAKSKGASAIIMKSAEGVAGEAANRSLKLTVKQENFCHAYIETGNASGAYRRAYNASGMKDKQIWEEACKILKNPKVSQRVNELKALHRHRHQITVDHLVAELEEARAIAKENGTPAAMVAATMGKGKLLGLIVDKAEHSGRDGKDLIPPDTSNRALARSILDILREARIEGQLEINAGHGDAEMDESGKAGAAPPSDEPADHVVANASIRVRMFNPVTGRVE
jgi:phage terminase small subunit